MTYNDLGKCTQGTASDYRRAGLSSCLQLQERRTHFLTISDQLLKWSGAYFKYLLPNIHIGIYVQTIKCAEIKCKWLCSVLYQLISVISVARRLSSIQKLGCWKYAEMLNTVVPYPSLVQ